MENNNNKKINPAIKFGIFVLLIVGLIILASSASKNAKIKTEKRITEMSSREAALLCTTDMATKYHIHPELKIIINGVEQGIPSNIGINSSCMNSIHTHSADGLIHVESPVVKDFVLADIFTVWDKVFTKDQILDYIADEKSKISVTVNGKSVDTFENTLLKDKEKIVISYITK